MLEVSLAISREIGDRAGTIPTLHNLAGLALQDEDVGASINFWSEALNAAMETGDALGIFNVSRDFGALLMAVGNKGEGVKLLKLAVQVGRRSGFSGVDEIEGLLGEAGESAE